MHDTIIAGMVLKDLKDYKGIKSVKIEVGEIAEIAADELRETMAKLVDYKVDISEIKAKVKCKCGYEGPPEILERGHHYSVFVCRKCGEVPEIVEGNEIRIKEVEVKSQLK
ncbi:hydrogenase/urease maturation nickel metallochaperone HypA [candidate division KSB1 bacterium]